MQEAERMRRLAEARAAKERLAARQLLSPADQSTGGGSPLVRRPQSARARSVEPVPSPARKVSSTDLLILLERVCVAHLFGGSFVPAGRPTGS